MADRLKCMKDRLVSIAETTVNGDLSNVDAKELGEVIDMIKDLSEAIVNCDIAESMEKASGEEKEHYIDKYMPEYASQRYYTPYYNSEHMRDLDRVARKRMYFTEPDMGHDSRDGKSYVSRRWYMEAKEMGNDASSEMEKYIKDLGEDIAEMIEDMTQNEKAILKQKMTTLASKIV